MHIYTEQLPNVTVISVHGALDHAESPALGQIIEETRARGSVNLLVDIENASHLNRDGIRFLTEFACRLQAEGGDLAISGLRPEHMQPFDAARLASFCRLYPSKQAALDSARIESEQ